eukprot:scaffold22944_cov31-Attheya_sp.AAC.1
MERLHVMVKEASVGIVNPKNLNFQNGGFPGSCGGPYIFHNKAVALHVDSVSTTTTVKDLQNEETTVKKGKKAGEKRKLTIAENTTMVTESCASSHTSLGTGIILQVRSGIMHLLKDED